MKIYFAGSIRGGRDDNELYLEIIKLLKNYGEVLFSTGFVNSSENLTDEYIYKRDMNWIDQVDVVVAEVTTPSLGVGYEIGKAEGKKSVLCLYRELDNKNPSAMISGNKNLRVAKYRNLAEIEQILSDFFNKEG